MNGLGSTTAVVLAGGLGTRLRPITQDRCPKPMVPVRCLGQDYPFLEFLVSYYRNHGLRDVVLCVDHLAEQILNHFGDGSAYGLRIQYDQTRAADTGCRVTSALPLVGSDPFLVICGDTFLPLDPAAFLRAFDDRPDWRLQVATVPAAPLSVPNLAFGADRTVTSYDRAGLTGVGASVDAGTLVLRKECLAGERHSRGWSIARHLYPSLIAGKAMGSFEVHADFFDIGTPAGYHRFCFHVAKGGAFPLSAKVAA